MDDKFIEILDGAWAVIYTATDGWEIEHQHCYTCFKLTSTTDDAAIVEGEKLAREIENRYRNVWLGHMPDTTPVSSI